MLTLLWWSFHNIYVYQITLYTLNLYNVICQLLGKIFSKKKNEVQIKKPILKYI